MMDHQAVRVIAAAYLLPCLSLVTVPWPTNFRAHYCRFAIKLGEAVAKPLASPTAQMLTHA